MSDKAVCRTALATPGLSIMKGKKNGQGRNFVNRSEEKCCAWLNPKATERWIKVRNQILQTTKNYNNIKKKKFFNYLKQLERTKKLLIK